MSSGSDVTRQLNSHGRLARSANNTQENIVHRFKYVISAALLAASQLATAATAEASISNINVTSSGGEGWAQLFKGVTWLPLPSGASVGLVDPSFSDTASGWQGDVIGASVAAAGSMAQAKLTATSSTENYNSLNGVSASAKVNVTGGQSGWANAKVFDGLMQVSGHTTITVTAALSSLQVSGANGQANVYIDFCSWAETCAPGNYTEAFIDSSFPNYSGPMLLTASWTNPGETTFARMVIGLTASADSVTAVPEPATMALWLAGLAGVGARLRRRKD
ncbi:PEP-CTERM sorting domain-containing protein [Roseateles sp. P5_E4]